MFQKISERHAWIVTRTLIISQGRRTVINLMTSNKKCHTDLSFMLLGPSTLFTSGEVLQAHRTEETRIFKALRISVKAFATFFPQELPILK